MFYVWDPLKKSLLRRICLYIFCKLHSLFARSIKYTGPRDIGLKCRIVEIICPCDGGMNDAGKCSTSFNLNLDILKEMRRRYEARFFTG